VFVGDGHVGLAAGGLQLTLHEHALRLGSLAQQVADWFVWLASTLGRFNANELRRADHEVHDIADGRYDGRIQKYQQGMSR